MLVAAQTQDISKNSSWPEQQGDEGLRGLRWGLCDGVLLYLLGGDEKQLLSPLLFPALSSSYPTLSFSKTLLFQPLSVCLPGCLAWRSGSAASGRGRGETAKWAVTRQLPALVVWDLQTLICVFSVRPFLSRSDLDFAPNLLFMPPSPASCLSLRLALHLFLMAAFLPERLVTLPAYQQPLSFLIFPVTPAPYACTHMDFNLELFWGVHKTSFMSFISPRSAFCFMNKTSPELSSSSKCYHWLTGRV